MWTKDDDDFNKGTGGFDVSGYGDSPSAAVTDNRNAKRPSSIFPVAIKQIIESNEDTTLISGYPVSMMTVVGIVISVETSSTKVVYTIQDWSGTITGMLWLDENSDQKQSVIENTYGRMTGTRRMHEGKPCMFVYNIVPVENLTELTYHYLQIIQIPLKAEELRQINQERMDTTYTNHSTNNTTSNFTSTDSLSLPPHQMKVYRVLQGCRDESGMDKNSVFAALQQQMSLVEIEKVIEFLRDEGHVYSTIDDDHYKVTDV